MSKKTPLIKDVIASSDLKNLKNTQTIIMKNIYFDNSANRIGIKTDNPQATLDVEGDLLVSGSITLSKSGISISPSNVNSWSMNKDGTRFLHNYGTDNTFLGMSAGNFTMTGQQNTCVGANVMVSNVEGNYNTAIGASALTANTSGHANVAIGASSLQLNNAGGNTAVGTASMVSTTTGSSNTAIGVATLNNSTTASNNTAIGASALYSATTGANNVAIGKDAGSNMVGGSNNIFISNVGIAEDYAAIRIGTNGTHTTCFIQGISGVTTNNVAVPAYVDNQGQLGTISSSARYKQDIKDIGDSSAKIMNLRPVTFKYKNNNTDELQYGLIAEEVHKEFPELVVMKDDRPETVKYHFLTGLLLNELQTLRKDHELLKAKFENSK